MLLSLSKAVVAKFAANSVVYALGKKLHECIYMHIGSLPGPILLHVLAV